MRRTLFLCLVFFLVFASSVHAGHTEDTYPKRANYFLNWKLTDSEARELAAWDLVILDMETQVSSRSQIELLRRLNPTIVLLAYITSQEIRQDALQSKSVMRQKLAQGIYDAWYLRADSGERASFWPGTFMLNMSDNAPVVDGVRMNDYLASFVVKEILATGLWDGVFYDNAWDSVRYHISGLPQDIDAHWQAGMKHLYNETRRLAGKPIILVGNGTTRAYRGELNGNMLENFTPAVWRGTMETYAYNQVRNYQPAMNIINANNGNHGGRDQFRNMRFGLASALLERGYYSYDFGDRGHGQVWQYDEYDIDLGQPSGNAVSKRQLVQYAPDIWQREYDHGVAVVNATAETQIAELSGEFEKIHGTDDPITNSGEIVTSVTVPPYDGIILLKALTTLEGVLYPNGAFVRFFHGDGRRARNGFFAFDNKASGGDTVGRVDLDANGLLEFVRATNNKVSGERDDGQPLFSLYPYTANFRGSFSLSTGVRNHETPLLMLPNVGSAQPVRIYTHHGEKLGVDWWPLGIGFSGGYSIAPAGVSDITYVVGSGKNQEPLVSLYRSDRSLVRQWRAFEKTFRGGIRVAVGDVLGDAEKEIIVGAGPGKAPIIKVFDFRGKELSSFTAFQTVGVPGVDALSTKDMDFDGKEEILVFSAGI